MDTVGDGLVIGVLVGLGAGGLAGGIHLRYALSRPQVTERLVGAHGTVAFLGAAPEIGMPLMPTRMKAQKKLQIFE